MKKAHLPKQEKTLFTTLFSASPGKSNLCTEALLLADMVGEMFVEGLPGIVWPHNVATLSADGCTENGSTSCLLQWRRLQSHNGARVAGSVLPSKARTVPRSDGVEMF